MTVYRIVAEWNLPNNNIGQNVIYCEVDGGDTADQSDLLDDFADEVARIFAPWLVRVVEEVILTLIRVYLFDPLLGTSVPLGVRSIGDPGLVSLDNPLPSGVAIKIKRYLPLRARPFGAYLLGASAGGVNNFGQITSTDAAAALGCAAAWTIANQMTKTQLTWEPRHYSEKDSAMLSAVGADNEIGSVFDYQRRRKGGVGI